MVHSAARSSHRKLTLGTSKAREPGRLSMSNAAHRTSDRWLDNHPCVRHSACMSEPPANDWERQYRESIAAEDSARHEAWLEYEPTLWDWRSYYLALVVPAAL